MFGGAASRLRTHSPRSWLLRLTIAGCLAAGLVASPASAAPGWSRPMNVSEVMSIGEESPLLRVDSAGNASVVWRRYHNGKLIYESAVGGAGKGWSTPSTLFGGLEDAYGLQIAVDPLGNETAVWGRHVDRSWVIQSATRPAGGDWSMPVTLSAAGAGSALVTAGPEGNVTAVWLLDREGARWSKARPGRLEGPGRRRSPCLHREKPPDPRRSHLTPRAAQLRSGKRNTAVQLKARPGRLEGAGRHRSPSPPPE
jgi:hypothetical protein